MSPPAPAPRGARRTGRRGAVWAGLAIVGLMLATLAGVPATAATPAAGNDPFGTHTPIMLVIDTSGSMDEVVDRMASLSGTRLDVARSDVLRLVDQLGADQPYGIIAYPGGGRTDDDNCSIGKQVVDLGAAESTATSAAVRQLDADGDTPTGPALRHAADELKRVYGPDARGVVVLFSDGESNCGKTPVCDVAKAIRREGLEVQINPVGLGLNEAAEEEMQCVADATGGRYIPVYDIADAGDAIARSAQGALSLSVEAPKALNVVVGTGTSGSSELTVTVGANGRVPAQDVRVTLQFLADGMPGALVVPRPVRFLGNIDPGGSRTVTYSVRPDRQIYDLSWRVVVTAGNALAVDREEPISTSANLGRGGVLADTRRAVVVGDSYSSGEGVGSYDEGSDGGPDGGSECHRSRQRTYAGQLYGADNTVVIACSGAVTADFFAPQRSGTVDVAPQLLALREEVLGAHPPDAVFLSVGGNDAGFGNVVMSCMAAASCFTLPAVDAKGIRTRATLWLSNAMGVQADVTDVLRSVDAVVNDAEALRNRGGDVAPIVVVPYPRIIPETVTAGTGWCMTFLEENELRFLNRFFDALNTAVRRAAHQVAGEGRPVYLPTDVIDAYQPNHTICDGEESWAVTAQLDDAVRQPFGMAYQLSNHKELLHPNADGHAATANAIAAWSHGSAARTRDVVGTPRWEPTIVRTKPGWLETRVQTALGILGPRTEAGGVAKVDRDGFLPATTVTVRIESTPRSLGSALADDDGRVDTWVRLPADIPRGTHSLVVQGLDADGELIEVRTDIEVAPAGRQWVVLMLGAGTVALLRGLAGRPWRRTHPSTERV